MRKINKWLATLLAVLLVAGCLPLSALAEGEETSAPAVEEQAETPEETSSEEGAPLLTAEVETYAAEDNSLGVVYVSAEGSDDTGEGTREKPVATLAKAVNVAKSGATIYVMSDLTMTECARFYGKHLTITSGEGGPYTLTRGDDFAEQQDSARSTYNPALIEVDSTVGPNTASLKLSNIILDDGGKHEGSYFVQADSEGDGHTKVGSTEVGNTDIVQDGIIATYNGVGTITLGEGTVLKNYGGMCAVRLSGGELIMEEGSQIIDEREITREKGATGSFGPAGAIWIQGGTLTMKGGVIGGAEGVTMNGRAVYVDSGTANVGGTIQNIKGADAAWQGQNGVAIHLRSGGEATLTETGKITNVTGTNDGNNCAIWTQFCNFTTKNGSEISNVDSFQLLHFDDLDNNNYSHEVYLDGRITDCDTGSVCLLRSWYGQITFGPNSVIENCSSNSAGGLIYSNNGSHYTFYGIIRNNTAPKGMIYLANQGGGGVIATIEEGAQIVDNKGLGVRVNNSSNLTMNGGEISRNTSYGVQISGKTDWRGVKFIMNGGKICDNGSDGVFHENVDGGQSLVEINGGIISGNKGLNGRQISAEGGCAKAAQGDEAGNEYTHVAANTLEGERIVYVSAGSVILPEGYPDVNLGRATTDAVNALKAGVAEEHTDWTAVGSSGLWVQPSATEFSFELDPTSSPKKTGLFVAYMQVNPDGSPVEGAKVTVEEVENTENIPITLKNLTADAPYAVMLFNNKEYTLAPDDITIYTGGGQGNEIYDDGGFPKLTIANSVDEIESMTIDNEGVTGGDLMETLLSYIDVTYTLNGQPVENDEEAGEYTVTLTWKDGLTNADVRVNGNNVTLGKGKLIVRYIEDVDGAQEGTNTHALLAKEPEVPVTHAAAIAESRSKFYTNDDENREVDAKGIQILDDKLLTDEDGTDRQALLEKKAKDYLGAAGEGQTYKYAFHYLDLVDAYNGNAWVSASNGTTVYLPYPEGVMSDTAKSLGVQVIHFKDLHREYGFSGQAKVEEAIAVCELETMDVTYDDNGIKFDVAREGFSPFAVVWNTQAYTITASANNGGKITPSGDVTVAEGDNQTFTITPDSGYKIADVKVDGDSVGAVDSHTFKNVDANHTITVTFEKKSSPPIIVVPPDDDDDDQPEDPDDTGVSDLLNTKDHDQYLFGYPEGTFGPGLNMTRAEAAQMFYNLLVDQDVTAKPVFDDVPEGAWYAEPVNVMAKLGIVEGVGDDKFEPDREITRAEFTAMAMRFAQGETGGKNIFSDVDEDDWFYDVVVDSIKYGWIEGYPDGTFRPANLITREEVTTIVNRMLGRLPDEKFIDAHEDDLDLFPDVTKNWAYYDVVEATNDHQYKKTSSGEDWTKLG